MAELRICLDSNHSGRDTNVREQRSDPNKYKPSKQDGEESECALAHPTESKA